MKASAKTPARLRVGEPIVVRNLTVIPLFGEENAHQAYLTLDEALSSRSCEVTEIGEGGVVAELRFVNRSDLPVLLLDGEELIGAKQNRVLNLSLLAAPQSETAIPVSCIEAGRWQFKSRDFNSTARVQHARGRYTKTASVSASLKSKGRAQSDQGEVWSEISRKASAMHTSSRTEALSDIFDAYESDIDDYASRVQLPEGANGAAFAINGKVLGLEMFDRADTCAKLMGKLVRSWSLDALERGGAACRVGNLRADAAQLAHHVLTVVGERASIPGLGEQTRFEGARVVGATLSLDERLVHSVAFVRDVDSADDFVPERLAS